MKSFGIYGWSRGSELAAKRGFWPIVIGVLALFPRLVFWAISQHPGLWDPTEYYLLGLNLYNGKGFVLDYVWSFANHPAAVSHPIDHWLPLPGVLVAGSFSLFGISVQAALLPFVLLGMGQSLLVYAFAGKIGASRAVRVFASLATAWMPWLFLSSLHTDTTTLFGVLAFGTLASVYLAATENGRWLWLVGVLIGLTMLTRNDGVLLIPASIAGAVMIGWGSDSPIRRNHVLGAILGLVVILLPWIARNQADLGTLWPGSTIQSMFVTDHEDFYAYSKDISLQTYLDQGSARIVGKTIFELMASVKLMITLPDLIFPVAILGGLVDVVVHRRFGIGNRPAHEAVGATLRPYLPALGFILLAWGAYSFLMPYLSQGGSFKKTYLAVLPFLLIFGAHVIERYVQPRPAFWIVIVCTLVLLLANAVELTRADFKLNRSQRTIYEDVKVELDRLQAAEDQEIIVMTRDPWSVNWVTGYRAVMVPNEPLDVILEAAARYGVTHILAPVPREAITAVDQGDVVDPRLERVANLPKHNLRLYRIHPVEEGSYPARIEMEHRTPCLTFWRLTLAPQRDVPASARYRLTALNSRRCTGSRTNPFP